MIRLAGIAAALGLLSLSTVFAALNRSRRVTLELGWATLRGVPVTVVVFGAVLLGMLLMLVVGVHSDLRVRRILRERLQDEGAEEQERIDRSQRDLFGPDVD